MAIVALAIKLDSKGPIFFRQQRFGFNNEKIGVLKFRSLYHDCADPRASKVVTKNDPRVTRVGRFIRKTSLDELPQLLNVVFRGNLSLVEPRPHAVQGKLQNRLFDETVDGYFARHRVKPGITGWAQINGWRGENLQLKKSKSASSSTFTISKIGRCCLIYTSFGERLCFAKDRKRLLTGARVHFARDQNLLKMIETILLRV